MKNTNILKLVPVMFSFFVMGFVDLVGISTNYIKEDFGLSDTTANLLPSVLFIWFLIFSVPTGMLMNKIGRRNTVILSLVISLLSMLTPFIGYSFEVMMLSFVLLGISNTLMQVSLNPLLTNVVSGNQLSSSLTLGQFFKAIASFLAPIIAAWAAIAFGNWRMLFLVFAAISVIPIIWLSLTPIKEMPVEGKTTSFKGCFSLLGDSMILLLFIGILGHVALDVGINITAPKILIERAGLPLSEAGYATSLYFFFRTIGCFSGAFILSRVSGRKFFTLSVGIMVLAIIGMFVFKSPIPIYVCIALIGLGNSNLFPIIFSQAMQLKPERNNEVSGLMIMGVSGGLLSLLMGMASDAMGSQLGAIAVLAGCIAYLLFLSTKIKS